MKEFYWKNLSTKVLSLDDFHRIRVTTSYYILEFSSLPILAPLRSIPLPLQVLLMCGIFFFEVGGV